MKAKAKPLKKQKTRLNLKIKRVLKKGAKIKITKKSIEQMYNKMTEWKDRLEEAVLEREDYFEEKSEKWQESDKGKEYQEMTYKFQELCESLDEAIYKAEEIFQD